MRAAIGLGIVIASALFAHLAAAAPARAAPIAPVFDDLDQQPDPLRTYAANAYTIIHEGPGKPNEEGSSWRVDRGLVMRLSVDYDAFFESVGRHDLAEQFASRLIKHRLLVGGGIFIQLGSAIVFVVAVAKESYLIGAIGLGMLVGGGVMWGIGSDMDRPTLPEDQALDMAARYNEALRAHLGLPPSAKTSAERRPAAKGRTFTLFPALGAGRLGLGLGGRF